MAGTSLGRLYVDLLMNTGKFETDAGRAARIAERDMRRIERAIGAGADKITGFFSGLGTAALGFTAALVSVDAIAQQFGEAIDYADKVDELSARLGISTEKLSAWGYAAKLSGSDLDTLAKAIPKLSKEMAAALEPTSASAKLFDTLGIKITDASGKLRDVEGLIPEIADRFKALQNDTLEQALAQDLLGKSGAELLEFFNRGGEGIRALEADLQSLGGLIDGETAQSAAAFKDELDRLKTAGHALTMQIFGELAPQMTNLVEKANGFVREGSNARAIADSLGVGFTLAGRAAEAMANQALAGASAIMAVYNAGQALAKSWKLDFSGATASVGNAFDMTAAAAQFATRRPTFGTAGNASPVLPAIDDPLGIYQQLVAQEQASKIERGYAAMLAGSSGGGRVRSGGTRAAGKSDAEREAEQLQRAFESSIARQQESLALLQEELRTGGEVSELFRMRYELENGQLKGLNEADKQRLLLGAEQADQLKKKLELLDEEQKRADRYKGVIEDLRLEAEALGMSNLQLEVRNNLMRAGVTGDSAEGMAIVANTEELDRLQRMADSMDNVRGIAESFLIDLPKGGKEAWENLLADLESMLLQWAAKGIIEKVFGEFGTTGQGSAGGGWLASIFGSGGGGGEAGGGWGSFLGSLFGGGRANGGPVIGGKFYEVNERGWPELLEFNNRQLLMMPRGMNGRVTPTAAGGAPIRAGDTHIHVHGRMSRQTAQQAAREAGRETQRAIRRNG